MKLKIISDFVLLHGSTRLMLFHPVSDTKTEIIQALEILDISQLSTENLKLMYRERLAS